jgi:hypothetical protein
MWPPLQDTCTNLELATSSFGVVVVHNATERVSGVASSADHAPEILG